MISIEKVITWLTLTQHRLVGSNQLRDYEKICLDTWRDSLNGEQKKILDAQIAAVAFIQRQAADAKVCFYYSDDRYNSHYTVPLFMNQQPDQHVADIVVKSVNGNQKSSMIVRVFVHRGRFFSIEFPKRPERYMQLHGMRKKYLRVVGVNKIKEL
jgi:hypothetical protein